ncbi:MAG: inositol monophosphatase [Elusimicrobiota bacterium]
MNEIEIAKRAAIEAGQVIKTYFSHVGYKLKGRANPVTLADIKSQEIIAKKIRKTFPKDSIIAEEGLMSIMDKKRLWIVDPLDGTVNFTHNFPHFAVSISFVENGVVKLGIIYDPMKNEFFKAIKDKGAFLNGKKIVVSKTKKLSDSLLATGFAYDRREKADFYCSFYSHFLKISHDIRRCGAASLDMAYVACGRIDGYWEFNLKPWDVAAGKLIVEEGGGKVSDFSGKSWKKDFNSILKWGKETLVCNFKIKLEMLRHIKSLSKILIKT